MSREVPFDEDATCDECGKQGAIDFMGDYLCPDCAKKHVPVEEDREVSAENARRIRELINYAGGDDPSAERILAEAESIAAAERNP